MLSRKISCCRAIGLAGVGSLSSLSFVGLGLASTGLFLRLMRGPDRVPLRYNLQLSTVSFKDADHVVRCVVIAPFLESSSTLLGSVDCGPCHCQCSYLSHSSIVLGQGSIIRFLLATLAIQSLHVTDTLMGLLAVLRLSVFLSEMRPNETVRHGRLDRHQHRVGARSFYLQGRFTRYSRHVSHVMHVFFQYNSRSVLLPRNGC